MKKRGQVAMEYLLMLSVALMLILPGLYLFRNYVFESNDQIIGRRLSEVSSLVLTKARKMYYYGPPSKSVIPVEMPSQLENMYILAIPDNEEYYLVYSYAGSKGQTRLEYVSDVPLDSGYPVCSPEPNCDRGYCKCFPEKFFSEGMKNLKVQANYTCQSTDICIIFDVV